MTFRVWTEAERSFLRRYAGAVPLAMLAADMRRDVRDVLVECHCLSIDPRYSGTPLRWCVFCSQWRHEVKAHGRYRGMCPVCACRRQIEAIGGRVADLWPRLTPEQREKYTETDAELGSTRDPPPSRPDLSGMGERERIVAETAYIARRSEWEAKQEHRRYKAAQKRKERIEAKVRENEGSNAMNENGNAKWEPVTSRHHLDPGIQPYVQKHVGMGQDEANRKAERKHYDAQYQQRYHTDAPAELFE